MRNLKRVLSLALAAIMLMGMMVMGASAANVSDFNDADQIGNVEAASIVTGLGIFKGDTSGNFDPQRPVTRAEMATVICKILYGSNVNGDNFKGTGTFADAKTYQGGWAEGYINMCKSQGIVSGYNDTTFGAADTVTTWQAALMLQRALGYWSPAAGEAISELTVTGKAANLGMYGDLTLSVDEPLTRENVAVLVFNALFAQRVHYDDVRGLYTKDNDRNVVVNNGTNDPANTLAQNTFGLYSVNGVVISNGYTNINLTGKSRVVFDDAADVNGDGRDEAEYSFEYATGLDMIGHAATVYYKIVRRAPVVYAVVDKAVKVEQTFVPGNLSTHARDKGFSRDTSETIIVKNYNLVDTDKLVSGTGYTSFRNAPMILISNSSDLTVDYAIILDQRLDYVTRLSVDNSDRDNPVSTYNLKSNGSGLRDDTGCVTTGDISQGSYVIYTEVTSSPKLVILSPAPVEQQLLTRVDRSSNGTHSNTKTLYTDSVKYSKAATKWALNLVEKDVACYDYDPSHAQLGTCSDDYAITPYADVLVSGEYNLIYDEYERLIAVSPVEPDKTTNIAYVAQFGYKINTNPSLKDSYALTAHVYFADGTNKVYYVDNTDGLFEGVTVYSDGDLTVKAGTPLASATLTGGVGDASVANSLNKIVTNGRGNGDYIKLYNVNVNSDGTVTLKNLDGQYANDTTGLIQHTAGAAGATAGKLLEGSDANTKDGISQIKKGVTWLGQTYTNGPAKALDLYGNSQTVFFYVNGVYDDDSDPLTVGVIQGMSGIPTVSLEDSMNAGSFYGNASDANDARTGGGSYTSNVDPNAGFVAQVAATQSPSGGYATVNGMLIAGYSYVNARAGIYFYNGSYTVSRVAADAYTLTYHVYDAKTGEAHELVYADQYKTDAEAKGQAKTHATGYYEDGGKDIKAWTKDPQPTAELVPQDGMKYVVEGIFKDYIGVGDVLTLYTIKDSVTDVNNYRDGVTITDDTLFVDLSGNRITSLEELAQVIQANQDSYDNAGEDVPTWTSVKQSAKLSYWYDPDENTVKVLFITDVIRPYSKDLTGSGSSAGIGEGRNTTIVTDSKVSSLDMLKNLPDGAYTLNNGLAAGDLTGMSGLLTAGGTAADGTTIKTADLADMLFIKWNQTDSAKATVTIRDGVVPVYVEVSSAALDAGAHVCSVQVTKTGTSTGVWNGAYASGTKFGSLVGSTAGHSGTPLSAGTYTWEVVVAGKVVAEGSFTIGG